MREYNTAPATHSEEAKARVKVQYKDSVFSLTKLQSETFFLLSNGKQHSSYQLMLHLKTSDPRREVKQLRDKGINIQDVWIDTTDTKPRHKHYFIDPKECTSYGD